MNKTTLNLNPVIVDFVFVIVSAVIFSLIFWMAGKDRVEVCYTLASEQPVITKIYWDIGAGFKEEQSQMKLVQSGENNSCLSTKAINRLTRLRIDPMTQLGQIKLSDIKLNSTENHLFSRFLTNKTLNIEDAQLSGVVVDEDKSLQAVTKDPWLSWDVTIEKPNSKQILVINTIVIGLWLLLTVFLFKYSTIHANNFITLLPILALYPLFELFIFINEEFFQAIHYHNFVLLFVLLITTIVALIGRRYRITSYTTLKSFAIGGITLGFIFDLLFRFSALPQPAFGDEIQGVYHWKLNRGLQHNQNHSSLNYKTDFNPIKLLLVPGSSVLADIPTSYYIAANLPVYSANTHPHHSKTGIYFNKLIESLCSLDSINEFKRTIVEENLKRKNNRLPEIRYLILNNDKKNRNTKSRCTTIHFTQIQSILDNNYINLFNGEYLSLWRLDNQP